MVSGPIGDHGTAVMLARGTLGISADIVSDTAPLNGLVNVLLDAAGAAVHVLRDATRGGVATVLNEVAAASGVAVVLEETALPVRPEVAGVCELLGLDPLYVACEGRMVVVVAPGGSRGRPRGHARPPPGRRQRHHRRGGPRARRPGAAEHRFRRGPCRRHAGGRPSAADLLRAGHDRCRVTSNQGAPGAGAARVSVRVEGIVQGVGFRPFVRNLATALDLPWFGAQRHGRGASSKWRARPRPWPSSCGAWRAMLPHCAS